MPSKCLWFDIAIVGGGMLGTMVAAKASELGKELRVICFRLSDSERPRAESLRNQGISQSGLRYIGVDRVTAELMRTSRRELLEFLAIRPSESRGVMQMSADQEVEFLSRVEGTPFLSEIQKLAKEETKELLGLFWDQDAVSYAVPEQHLDIATVMRLTREIARTNGVAFREVNKINIKEQPSMPSLRLVVEDNEVEAGMVVFAAGCGNLPFLEKLKPDHQYKIRQTPLLIVGGPPKIRTPVFFDRKNGRSIVAHDPCDLITAGCMIIGTSKGDRDIKPYCEVEKRNIDDAEAHEIIDSLEKHLPWLRTSPDSFRFTAGWEPIPPDGNDFKPQIIGFPETHEHHDVLFAFPGRATLALHAAELVIEAIRRTFPSTVGNRRGAGASAFNHVGKPWLSRISMHFEDYYKQLNDHGRGEVRCSHE